MRTNRLPFAAALLLALGGPATGAAAQEAPTAAAPPTAAEYEALWAGGATYNAFYEAATARRELWVRNTEAAALPPELVARAGAVPGTWRLLAVAVDGCSDSVNTIPYIAALADAVAGLDLRIVTPQEGAAVMEAFRTPDGRAATPTVVLLDGQGHARGVFIERPDALQSWYLENPEELSNQARYEGKMRWYENDAGASTLAAMIALLETAAATR